MVRASLRGISVAFSASVVLKNGTLTGFANGIQVQFSPRITLRNVAVTNNRTGIAIINNSPNSLVKDCTASGNGIGVVVEGIAQVEGCVIEGNANENGANGIQADCPSTITNNEALQNGDQNIVTAGAGCFVKGNVTGVNPP